MKRFPLLAAAALCLSLLSPVGAHAGIKYWDNPAYRAFDVDCYVPGAVWNLDGIRNVGATADHDPTALTWKNLGSSGAANDVFLQKNTGGSSWASASAGELAAGTWGEWAADGFVFKGHGRMRRDSSGANAGYIETGTNFTFQLLVDADASAQQGNDAFPFSAQYARCAIDVRERSKLIWCTDEEYAARGNAYSSFSSIPGPSFDYVTAIMNGETKSSAFFSGTEAPTSGDGFRQYETVTGHAKENGYGIGSSGTGTQGFIGTLKFFRYYKKALTNEEVAWNRVVDEARFFNRVAPLPVTNVVVVSAVAASTEPAGTYAVDGSHLFTAPRVATVGNAKYVCTGYTLETWDAETGGWGAPVFHARELSCAATEMSRIRITWQWIDGEGLKTYDVSDYVWDGLEVFYDGICNQGTNVAHSTTATKWVNIGNGPQGASNNLKLQRYTGSAWADATSVDAVGNYDPGEWTENGFRMAGQGRFRCDYPGGFTVGTSYSLQMLIDAKASEQVTGTSHAYPFAVNNETFAFDINDNGTNYWCVLNKQSDLSAYPLISGGVFDYFTAIMDGDNNKQSFFSGTKIPTSGTGVKNYAAAGFNETGFALGGFGKTTTTERFVGTIKSFRQYDHALSPAEVAQNRKVDDFRFFGKFAETDVIVQSTYAALQGNEPDGEYDVDGLHTFTAPANVTIKVNGREIEYACDGYTVEKGYWNTRASTTFFVCTNAQTVASTSYTHDETAGLVRLTWLWRPVRGLRTAADYSFDDYSQAGLVWNYDGIYNAGVGVHNPSATTWKNLGDRANSDLHWNNQTSTGHWADDGYVFAGGPRFKGNAGFCLRNCTMQTLIDGNPADQTVVEPYSFNGSGNYFNFRLIKDSYNGPAANSFCWDAQNGTRMFFHAPGNQYGFATGIQDFDNKKAMMFQDTTIPAEYVADGTYGAQRLYHEFASMKEVKDDGYGLGNISNGSAGFVGTVKFFRYYDRVLTEEELVRNRNADAVRYFGALGVTNLVVEAAEGDAFDCDPAPGAYYVEGSWTFTAAGTAGGKAPVGYRLQDWDPVNGHWTNSRQVESLSFTYDAATAAAKQRLTWVSRRPLVVILR